MKGIIIRLLPIFLIIACSKPKPVSPWAIPSSGPSLSYWKPTPGLKWQIQFSGKFKTIPGIEVYDLDLFDTPESTIKDLHLKGNKVICYFSAGSFENWRPDAAVFSEKEKGEKLTGWEGENWLDIRSPGVHEIMKRRLLLAKQKGCDAVDPDNIDGFANDNGLNLKYEDQLKYNEFLAREAHALGMAIGLKNDLQQINDLVDLFDFAINESCNDYNECELLKPFIAKNKPVLAIDYSKNYQAHCKKAAELKLDMIVKNKKLDDKVIYCP